MRAMLEYMYTGCLKYESGDVVALMFLADQYSVEALVMSCGTNSMMSAMETSLSSQEP